MIHRLLVQLMIHDKNKILVWTSILSSKEGKVFFVLLMNTL